MRKYPHHRFAVKRQKEQAREFDNVRPPGWLHFDVDFGMDGEILPPGGRAVQSDHWSPMTYTIFINVASWLRTEAWTDRKSVLVKSSAVTVEPSHLSTPGSVTPHKESFCAMVVSTPTEAQVESAAEPETLSYGVIPHGESAVRFVQRQYMRHRVMHTVAFVHISNDKSHDSIAAQTFITLTLKNLEDNYISTGAIPTTATSTTPPTCVFVCSPSQAGRNLPIYTYTPTTHHHTSNRVRQCTSSVLCHKDSNIG